MPEGAKVRQVGLGAQLRRLRHTTGKNTRSGGDAVGVSPSSGKRTEMGKRENGKRQL